MAAKRYNAEGRVAEALAAAAFVAVVALLLWPPGAVYWTGLADVVGVAPTLVFVALLAAGLGGWFARTASIGMGHLVLGAVCAYGVGMLAIELFLAPESPVHWLWYGALVGCVLAGAALWRSVAAYRHSG